MWISSKLRPMSFFWDDLIRSCALTGKPLVISTGMATMPEILHAVTVARDSGCTQLTLLHCISGYPTPPSETNLSAINTLRTSFNCSVGWSDHSVSPGVLYRAIHAWGATTIEFHLDLEGEGEEFAAGHCWLPDSMKTLIQAVRIGMSADGDGIKIPSPSELSDREWRADPIDGLRPNHNTRLNWNP